jgi:hypothetical protein
MKPQSIIGLIGCIFLVAFLSVGCATTPVEYSFIQAGQRGATIGFLTSTNLASPSASFVSFDGRGIPRAERKTHWDPLVFPSGRELRIIVHAKYDENTKVGVGGLGVVGDVIIAAQSVSALSRNVDADVEFICPPLVDGGRYQISFSKGTGLPGSNTLILTDIATGSVIQSKEFEVALGGYYTR